MSAHTPGPWFADKHGVVRAGPIRQYYSRGEGRAQLAAVKHLEVSDDESSSEMASRRDADARLIAAAPELLAALEELERLCHAHDEDAVVTAAAAAARAAIAKARGES